MAPVYDDASQVRARVARVVRERLLPAVHHDRRPLTVEAWAAPGEPVPFAQARTQRYAPFAVGTPWGRPWETVWFHVTGAVPEGWEEPELLVDLGFGGAQPGFQAEGLVYDATGRVVQGIAPRRPAVPLGPGPVDLYVEAAANPNIGGSWEFAPTTLGDLATAGDAPLYRLVAVDVAQLDRAVFALLADVRALDGLAAELPTDRSRRAEILRALSRSVDALDPDDVPGTAAAARAELADVLAAPADAGAHRVFAVGHSHLDSAWLWPVRETVRKVTRTFANVVALLDEHDELVFAASSAQQYAWLQEHQPELFARVAAQVKAGRFVPVGGMWVESDTNMPGGEALARQFVAGKRYFLEQFGVEPREAWLPDSFGYSAALPQIIAAAGSRWFLTQKTSWNDTNLMPHHTFRWEGIDGTRIFTHFPPVDTYSAELTAAELAHAERRFAEKGRATASLVPFGHGDGGGGPTREMLAAAARTRSLAGSPTVRIASPAEFFTAAEEEYAEPPVWSGELYLEFHRGTYTSQARTKRGNRRSEHLLREAELWAATAAVRTGAAYPYDTLEACWRTVLLQQFHDILPGTSIAWVHRQAEQEYARVAAELTGVIDAALQALTGEGAVDLAANAGPFAVGGVSALGIGTVAAEAPPTVEETADGVVLANDALRVVVDRRGLLTSIHAVTDPATTRPPRASRGAAAPHRIQDREVLAAPGNLLQLFRDTPTRWDAWDVDVRDRRISLDLVDATVTVDGATVQIVRSTGPSTITQTVTLRGPAVEIVTEVDWHDRQKLLKLAFPLDVHADRATSEIQFGHVHRATHANTSWDTARFETCAHRWVHVGETGYGVAVANDATYGHDIARHGRTTTVRLSLLRAPLFPDPDADQGVHRFTVALRPGATIGDAVAEGYRLNVPPRRVRGETAAAPLLALSDPAVVVEAVKLADDRSGDLVVRLYESRGGRARATVTTDLAHGGAVETDLLERPLAEPAALRPDGTLELRPFQIVTLRYLSREGPPVRLDDESPSAKETS